MGISVIKRKIKKAVNNERSTDSFANLIIKVASDNGNTMSLKEARGISNFVINYIEAVPVLIDEGLKISRNLGIQNEMNQMVKELKYYWELEQDLLPDNLGLIGITDDAYATTYLLQTLSDYCKSMFGRPLLILDLTQTNKFVRGILGEEIAIALEQKVQVTIGSNMVNQVFNQVYQNIFSSGFAFGNPFQAYNDQREIEQLVDVQMGALGIF